VLSDQRGFVQTFVDLSPPEPGDGGGGPRTTENTRYVTGVSPGSSDGTAYTSPPASSDAAEP